LLQYTGGFAFIDNGECTSLLRRVLDVYLQEMTTDGFISAAKAKYLAKIKEQDCSEAPTGQTLCSLLPGCLLRRKSQACNKGRNL